MIIFFFTKHNVSCTDKDDIEIVRSTDMARPVQQKIRMCGSIKQVTYLSMAISLEGSIDGRREDAPDGRRSEPRLSLIL